MERRAGGALALVPPPRGPTNPAIEALPDGRRRLRRPAKTLHADRPGLGLGAVGFANGFFGGKPGVVGVGFRAPDPAAIDGLAGFGAPRPPNTARLSGHGKAHT